MNVLFVGIKVVADAVKAADGQIVVLALAAAFRTSLTSHSKPALGLLRVLNSHTVLTLSCSPDPPSPLRECAVRRCRNRLPPLCCLPVFSYIAVA